MYLGNVILAVNDFVKERNEHVKRVHISHDDLDGYGCTAIIKIMSEEEDRISGSHSKTPITYINIDAPSKISSVIRDCVDTVISQGFDKEHDLLYFMITDIGSVNPDIFREINDVYGVTCAYVLVDHHVRVYNGDEDKMEVVQTPDGKINKIRGYYFVYTGLAATYIISDIYERIHNAMSDGMSIQRINLPGNETAANSYDLSNKLLVDRTRKAIRDVADCINKYDTGKWGKWYNLSNASEVAPEVLLQMAFTWFKDHGYDFSDVLVNVIKDVNDTQGWYSEWSEHVLENYNKLTMYMDRFVKGMKEYHTISTLGVCIDGLCMPFGINIKYYIIRNKETDDLGGCFSLISREILDSTNTDLLILIDYVEKTVSLRSSENGVNCARIARANGGGGHIRAAGFPII